MQMFVRVDTGIRLFDALIADADRDATFGSDWQNYSNATSSIAPNAVNRFG
jgi:hypothetical protein